MEVFFRRVFRSLGEKVATFALRNKGEEIQEVVAQYNSPYYAGAGLCKDIVELLEEYGPLAASHEAETLSDQDEVELSRRNIVVDL